jgi:hypothetical protein
MAQRNVKTEPPLAVEYGQSQLFAPVAPVLQTRGLPHTRDQEVNLLRILSLVVHSFASLSRQTDASMQSKKRLFLSNKRSKKISCLSLRSFGVLLSVLRTQLRLQIL